MTRKAKILTVSLSLFVIAAAGIAYALLYHFRVIPHGKYDAEKFGIETYKSKTDKDGDGIDDQTDILLSVKAYLDTKPRYKSAYYENGGWPDDGYGVCTDVVAQGLLGAGYDLQELIDADRRENPWRYQADEKPDRMIDFRRVRNQLPYFQGSATVLTTDTTKIEEWQGGDIVVWQGHVGVISEHRNYKGVPFVYHHGSPKQAEYEEDILETFGEILGHFRVS